ncbi:hypothetical protein ISN75_06790 [Dyella marensis]|uniref:hypothetical protein n=1 Tax=Dyella marensis TaxID=500610 RepID=UPI0031DE5211
MSANAFTSDMPTECGWYWVKPASDQPAQIVQVVEQQCTPPTTSVRAGLATQGYILTGTEVWMGPVTVPA